MFLKHKLFVEMKMFSGWCLSPNDYMKSNKKLKSLDKYYLIEFRRVHLAEMFLCIKYIAGKTLHSGLKIFCF